jgi:subtilase family serine protease
MVDLTQYSIPVGPQFLIVVADHLNQLSECDENNNIASMPVIFTDPAKPDLIIHNLIVEQTCILPGDVLDMHYEIANIGKATSDNSTTYFFLSTKDSIDADAILLMTKEETGNLGPGTGRSMQKQVTMPNGINPGFYFLIGCADFPEEIMEENEKNNCAIHWIEVRVDISECKPDITIYPEDIEGKYHPGSSFTVSYIVRNLNPVETGLSSSIRFLLSTDREPDDSDVELFNKWVPSIPASVSIPAQQNLMLPSSLSVGMYYILLCYDPEDLVMEQSEENNWGFSEITVLGQGPADLAILNLEIPDECLFYNAPFGVCYRVFNAGFTLSDHTTVNYYLSRDPSLSTDDTLIHSHDLQVIAICEYLDLKEIIYLTAKLEGGTYFLIVDLDPDDFVIESNENNNRASISKELKIADIELTKDLPDPAEVCAGERDTLQVKITNRGNLDAGTFYVGAYLSADDQGDTTDILISYRLAGPLDINEEESVALDFEVPDEPGKMYYLIFKANFLESVPEGNLINNECAQKIRIVEKQKQGIDLIEFYYFQKNTGPLNPTVDMKN